LNVLLDLDGTLIDPKEGILLCIKFALSGLGEPCPSDIELQEYIGPPLHASFGSLFGAESPKIAKAVALYRDRFSAKGIFEHTIYPEIPSALESLTALGAVLIVATSKATVFAERIIEDSGLARHIRAVYGANLDGTLSDKTELISHILKAERIPPTDTSMVGDRKYDMIGAKACGVFAVGALWGYGSREELVAAGASALCRCPTELHNILSSNFSSSGREEA
jgi:phosphoglycolate phosphatase